MYQAALKTGVQSMFQVTCGGTTPKLPTAHSADTNETTRSLFGKFFPGGMTLIGVLIVPTDSSMACRTPYIDKSLAAGMHPGAYQYTWTDVVDIGKRRHEGASLGISTVWN
jgi:hypothetical protein